MNVSPTHHLWHWSPSLKSEKKISTPFSISKNEMNKNTYIILNFKNKLAGCLIGKKSKTINTYALQHMFFLFTIFLHVPSKIKIRQWKLCFI